MNTTLNKSPNYPEFQVKDLVFAKVRGHKHWPAQIENIDNKTSRNIIKYTVRFFVTNEIAIVNKNDMCLYHANKAKYLPESMSLRHRDMYKAALSAIEEVWEAVSLPDRVGSTVAAKQKISSPNKNKTNSLRCSTPLVYDFNREFDESCDRSKQDIPTRDASVNTTIDLDLKFQLNAVTDRCIELEKSLMEVKTSSLTNEQKELHLATNSDQACSGSGDFQTQILIQELNKAKEEIKNLKTTIELLESDRAKLESEVITIKEKYIRCSTCFPPFQTTNKQIESNRRQIMQITKNKNKFPVTNHLECSNRFSALEEGNETMDNPSSEQVTPNFSAEHMKYTFKLKRKPQAPKSNKLSKYTFEGESKLLIVADSHGRDLSGLVQRRTEEVRVQSFVRPGAGLYSVTHDIHTLTKNLSKKDHLLLVAGTNSVEKISTKRLTNDLFKIVNELNHTNVILASLPMRHDKPGLDLKVSHINALIEEFIINTPSVKLLPLHNLPRHLHTHHGLHLNRKGKVKISSDIEQLITSSIQQPSNSGSPCMPPPTTDNGIAVVEAHNELMDSLGTLVASKQQVQDTEMQIQPRMDAALPPSATLRQPTMSSVSTRALTVSDSNPLPITQRYTVPITNTKQTISPAMGSPSLTTPTIKNKSNLENSFLD